MNPFSYYYIVKYYLICLLRSTTHTHTHTHTHYLSFLLSFTHTRAHAHIETERRTDTQTEEFFYLITHSTHFMYDYMGLDIGERQFREPLFPINKDYFIFTITQTGLYIPRFLLHQLWSCHDK